MTRALFIHVPKTAGTSLYRTLCKVFGESSVHNPRVRGPMDNPAATDHPIVFGHFHYRPEFREHFDWIGTVLRDPTDRMFSLYRHARSSRGRTLALHDAAQAPFGKFVRLDEEQIVDWQTRQLSCWRKPHVTEAAYTRAVANLYSMDWVDTYDVGGRSIKGVTLSIARALGRGVLESALAELPHERKGDDSTPRPTAAERRVVQMRNRFDQALVREFE